MSKKINKIFLPKELTLDSIITLTLVYNYCADILDGLLKAEIEFRASMPSDKDIDYYIKSGILPIVPMKKEFVLQELISYADLKLDEHPSVNHILECLKHIKKCALGEHRIFSPEYVVEIFKQGKSPEKAIKVFLPIMKSFIELEEKKGKQFFNLCKESIKSGCMTSFTVFQDERELKVVFMDYKEDNQEDLIEYLFYKKDVMADVVVIFGDKGKIIIRAKMEKKIDLLDVIAILRVETARKNKIPFDKINKHILNRPGIMPGIPHWNFNVESSTIISTQPPHMDKSNIKRALLIGIDLNKMAKGMCPSKEGCISKKCDFYSYNMLRCRKRRAGVSDGFEQKVSESSNIRVLKN